MLTLPNLVNLVLVLIPLLVAVTFHELAHGYAAYRLGDPTAHQAGRLTLNPLKHLDLFGSVILPLMLKLTGAPFVFGYAKPVPVNFTRLHPPRGGTLVVSAAGVAANAALAVASALMFKLTAGTAGFGGEAGAAVIPMLFRQLCAYSTAVNVVLAVFNLIPVPPLDGSRILAVFLPASLQFQLARLERFGIIIVFGLLLTGALDWVFSAVLDPILNVLL